MTIKTILYIIMIPIVLWALDSININSIFKKNRYYQARLFYLILTIVISYLLVNFIIDFTNYTKFV
jgi:uncharacterized integral membrane protein (TIGR02327 family)